MIIYLWSALHNNLKKIFIFQSFNYVNAATPIFIHLYSKLSFIGKSMLKIKLVDIPVNPVTPLLIGVL